MIVEDLDCHHKDRHNLLQRVALETVRDNAAGKYNSLHSDYEYEDEINSCNICLYLTTKIKIGRYRHVRQTCGLLLIESFRQSVLDDLSSSASVKGLILPAHYVQSLKNRTLWIIHEQNNINNSININSTALDVQQIPTCEGSSIEEILSATMNPVEIVNCLHEHAQKMDPSSVRFSFNLILKIYNEISRVSLFKECSISLISEFCQIFISNHNFSIHHLATLIRCCIWTRCVTELCSRPLPRELVHHLKLLLQQCMEPFVQGFIVPSFVEVTMNSNWIDIMRVLLDQLCSGHTAISIRLVRTILTRRNSNLSFSAWSDIEYGFLQTILEHLKPEIELARVSHWINILERDVCLQPHPASMKIATFILFLVSSQQLSENERDRLITLSQRLPGIMSRKILSKLR